MKKILCLVILIVLMIGVSVYAKDIVFDSSITDWSPVIQAKVNALATGETLTLQGGVFTCKTPIDLSSMKPDTTFECYGVLDFPDGVNGVILSGNRFINVYIQRITGKSWESTPQYDTYAGTGIKLHNVDHSNIQINRVDGFNTGILLSSNSGSGLYYNEINFRTIRQCNNCVVLRLEDNGGFITSNRITGGSLYGNNGILCNHADSVTKNNLIHQNMFYSIGFEKLSNSVLVLKRTTGNVFYSPRLEGGLGALPTSGWIDEDSTNSKNMFYVENTLYAHNALNKQKGKLSRVIGNIMSPEGVTIAREKNNLEDGACYYISDKLRKDTLPNTYYWNGNGFLYYP
jgi:hypothetical protein